MALLDDVKVFLNITHDYKDTEIQANIDAAKAEIIRMGVPEEMVSEDDPLIVVAIKYYCASLSEWDPDKSAKFEERFRSKADDIRKSPGYMVV